MFAHLPSSTALPLLETSDEFAAEMWQDVIPARFESRRMDLNVSFQTAICPEGGKEYHISLSCEQDPTFFYETIVTPDSYQRLVFYERLATPFSQFPALVHQLLSAVSSSCPQHFSNDTVGVDERVFVNVVSRNNSRSEVDLLITSKQFGCVLQSKRLIMTFTLCSDTKFKQFLLVHIEKLQRKSRNTAEQMVDVNRELTVAQTTIDQLGKTREWQQKQMDLLHRMLESSQELQRHYENLMQGYIQSDRSIAIDKPTQTDIKSAILFDMSSIETSSPFRSNIALINDSNHQSTSSLSSSDDATAAASESTSAITETHFDDDDESQPMVGIGSYLLCSICPDGVALPDYDQMKDHLISEHTDDDTKCVVCPDEQQTDADLLTHMMGHTGRVYACKFCGKKGRMHYLKVHIRTHTGEKPYKCGKCGRCFADSSTYRRHERTHSGIKPYQCPICGRHIARKDNVKVHLRSHMKDSSVASSSRH